MMTTTKALGRLAMFAGVLLLHSTGAAAATYYLSATGNNNNSCSAAQSSSTPKAAFASMWSCLAAGDTLIVADGTYSGDPAPPSGKAGSAGAYITIQAQNDGGPKITTGMFLKNNSYIAWVGLKFTGSSEAIHVESAGTGKVSHHLTFQRIGFTCTDTNVNDNACFQLTDGTHHVLLEDFWGWGGGRYTVMLYGGPGGSPPNTTADYNTLRRGVLRMGPSSSSSGNPQAGLALYYASNNLVENVIVLDSQAASNSSNSAFYLTSHAAPPYLDNNKYYGVIALNNYGIGWYLDHDGTGRNNELHDSVIWASADDGIQVYSGGTCSGHVIDHVTIGGNKGNGLTNYNCTTTSVKSSLVASNTGYGLLKGSGGSMGTVNWNDIFGNSSGARSGVTAGANDKTTDPALKYIGRIETGSTCVGAGEAGSNCGADVQNRYQDGVKTTQSLWPWPNEARIKAEMCASTPTRGFCAATSLTDYVWNYLGNGNPFGGTMTQAPRAPTNVRIIR